jgi:putative transposase
MYHVIFVCKYRKKVLERIDKELKQKIHDIEKESDFEILEMETDRDHIHLLIKSQPKVSILSIVRKLKQETTNRLWKSHENYLKRFYWGEKTLWSNGYFASTIGNVSQETAAMYIRNQG